MIKHNEVPPARNGRDKSYRSEQAENILKRSNLTQNQFLIWMGQKLSPGTPLYNMILTFTIEGEIDLGHFRSAFQTLVNQSDALRTVIREEEGVPQQISLAQLRYEPQYLDLSVEANSEATYQEWLDERKAFQFNIAECLFDTALIRVAQKRYIWYLNQHHLITDGWSVALVYRHLAKFYKLALNHQLKSPPTLPAFQAYVEHERHFRHSPQYEQALNYWQNKLTAPFEPINFYGQSLSENMATPTERLCCALGPERSQKLRAVAVEDGIRSLTLHLSLFNIFSTILFAYLHRISGNQQLRIGTPFHNRPSAAFKETIGLFIEIGPLQINVAEEETFLSLIKKVADESLESLRHAQPGISNAVQNKTYDVLLNYIHASNPDFNGLPIQSEWVHAGYGDGHHSLRLQVHDYDETGSFVLHFDLNCEVFKTEDQRGQAVQHFLKMVDAFLADRTQSIKHINLLSDAETQKFLVQFNKTTTAYPSDKTIVHLFEAQVEQTPHDTAIIFGKQQLTYAQLNHRTNQLAIYLREQGVGLETMVGIYMERSLETVVGLLAVLKAGGAYVPLDPAYPKERLAFMLQDAQVPLLLTQKSLVGRLPDYTGQVLCLDADWEAVAGYPADNPAGSAGPDNLTYVIYTSGSTGQPKGTLIQHGGLMNYVWWARKYYLQGERLDFPFFSTLSFDLTVTSIYVPLISGGKIVVYGEEDDDGNLAILKVIEDDAVDIIKLTPAHLSLLKQIDIRNTRLKKLIVGGEDFKTDLADRIVELFNSRIEIYNEYGPTEAVVGCMIHRFNPKQDRALSVPIGTPIDNAQVYLLDSNLNPVPAGIIGEMYIAGAGIARGYLNQPDLTAQRFLSNPFKPGERLYRTGDLARWNSTGQMEFLGRKDHQVKIRGARIELGEIESAMLSLEAVQECVIDVVQYRHPAEPGSEKIINCASCGLSSNYPNITFDEQGVCSICRDFAHHQDRVVSYFNTREELRRIFAKAKATKAGKYDCLMLLSGGKDSTYVLYQLVEMDLNPLVFSLDNGYISEEAKANIRRVTNDLGVDLEWGTTPHMNAIFADSLKQFSNVCNGCFKTIYTLSMNLAQEKGIKYIVTGLSRGQLFETRLSDMFDGRVFDADQVDRTVLEARKAYHRMDDAVSRLLDVEIFKNDSIFNDIQFIDFYRYWEVELDEMYTYLDKHAPWIRPTDTGRSTNCLINNVGIYIHKKERGFHNYALPYSWDVRLGHKTRTAAIEELNDEIDISAVRRILSEIGYPENYRDKDVTEKRLAAYYTSETPLTNAELRQQLSQLLPDYMLPSYFIHLDRLPLTKNGKVDRNELPHPGEQRPELETGFTAPRNQMEQTLAKIWAEIFRLKQVGIYDNFFDLGGDSIISIQIVTRARQAGYHLTPKQLFQHQNVADLAAVVAPVHAVEAEQGPVTGTVPLTPLQHWFFEQRLPEPHHWHNSLLLTAPHQMDPDWLEKALRQLLLHHDALRLQFVKGEDGWQQFNAGPDQNNAQTPLLHRVDLTGLSEEQQMAAIEAKRAELRANLSLAKGRLLQAALFNHGSNRDKRLLIIIHPLAVDDVSWRILWQDLETLYEQHSQGRAIQLPAKTSSFKTWSEKLTEFSRSEALLLELNYWQTGPQPSISNLPVDYRGNSDNTVGSAATISVFLSAGETQQLLHQIPAVYNTQINDVLLTALVQAFSEWTGVPALTVHLEGHGREEAIDGVDVSRTVGRFSTLYPATLTLAGGEDLGTALKSIKEQLRRIPDRGLGYGLLRYLGADANAHLLSRSRPPAELFFYYLDPSERLPPESSLFRLTDQPALSPAHQGRQGHLLEITSFIVDGRLQIDWTYSEQRHQRATIERLAQYYLKALQLLVAHCLLSGAKSYTPSDFPQADVGQGELDDILLEFSESID